MGSLSGQTAVRPSMGREAAPPRVPWRLRERQGPHVGWPSMEGPKDGTSSSDKDCRGSWLLLCCHGVMLVLHLLDCCGQRLDLLHQCGDLILLVRRRWRWWDRKFYLLTVSRLPRWEGFPMQLAKASRARVTTMTSCSEVASALSRGHDPSSLVIQWDVSPLLVSQSVASKSFSPATSTGSKASSVSLVEISMPLAQLGPLLGQGGARRKSSGRRAGNAPTSAMLAYCHIRAQLVRAGDASAGAMLAYCHIMLHFWGAWMAAVLHGTSLTELFSHF